MLLCPPFAGLFEDISVLEFTGVVRLDDHADTVEGVLQCFP